MSRLKYQRLWQLHHAKRQQAEAHEKALQYAFDDYERHRHRIAQSLTSSQRAADFLWFEAQMQQILQQMALLKKKLLLAQQAKQAIYQDELRFEKLCQKEQDKWMAEKRQIDEQELASYLTIVEYYKQ